jgi:SAM-dependent methyltransferase
VKRYLRAARDRLRAIRQRLRPESFDEAAYLDANPDVAAAIASGQITNGADHYESFGRAEGRALVAGESRNAIVRAQLDPDGRGLELGPLDRPIMPKREGFSVEVVDYLSTDDLRAKYGADIHAAIDASMIEEVDFVSHGQSLVDLVGGEGQYEWVVASHVIEHIPDLVMFFQDVERILSTRGRLGLVVPDKRFCFDVYGELSTTGQLLDAHLQERTRPTPGQAFDYYSRTSELNGSIAWGRDADGVPRTMYGFDEVKTSYESSIDGDDFGGQLHCWRFTPESFRLIIEDLGRLGLIALRVVGEHDTVGCEFFVTLGRDHSAADGPVDRLAMLQATRASDRMRPTA